MGIGIALDVAIVARCRHQPVEGGNDIAGDIRVGVLVNRKAGCRVGYIHMADTGLHTALFQLSGDHTGNIQQLDPGIRAYFSLVPIHDLTICATSLPAFRVGPLV